MSRIGNKPIDIPQSVTVQIDARKVEVKGPKGTLSRLLPEPITAKVDDGRVIVERPNDQRTNRALHGLTRALIANMVEGVSRGFEKRLLINGVGYRAQLQGKKLVLSLGYSHPVEVEAPEGIAFEVGKKLTDIKIMGIDKALVGQVAANIRKYRKAEPYKGKGIRYENEYVRRKAGKSVAAGK